MASNEMIKTFFAVVITASMTGGAHAGDVAMQELVNAALKTMTPQALSGTVIPKAVRPTKPAAAMGTVKTATLFPLIPLLVDGEPKIYAADRYSEVAVNFRASEDKFRNDLSEQGRFNYTNAVLLRMQIERCQKLALSRCAMLWQGDQIATLSMFGTDAWATAAHVIDGFVQSKALKQLPGRKILFQSAAVLEINDAGGLGKISRLFLPKTTWDPGSAEIASIGFGRDAEGKQEIELRNASSHLELTDFALISFNAGLARKQIEEAGSVTPVDNELLTIALEDTELHVPAGIVLPDPRFEASGFKALIGIKQPAGAKRTIRPGDSGRAVKDAHGRFVGVIVAGNDSPSGVVFILSFDASKLVP